MTVDAGPTTFQGVGVGRGMVVGPVAKAHPSPAVPSDGGPGDAEALRAAFAAVAATLQERAGAAEGAIAEVLAATAQIAQDPALLADAEQRVAAGESPAQAVDRAVDRFAEMFRAAGGYLAERVTDLRSVRDRVLALLLGLPEPGVPALEVPSVVVAEDLSPADTAALEVDKVLAIVTEHGGPTGHTAIIAGQLGLPCVVRTTGVMEVEAGREVAVDAATGTVVVDPAEELRAQARERARVQEELEGDTAPGSTADGHAVALLANIGTAADAGRAAATPAEGVGLFRTEVLFLERSSAPTLEEQTAVYAEVLGAFAGRGGGDKVVVRTLDAGADKPLAFVTQPGEENPALGVRGYRLVRREPELLRTQLAALAQAAKDTGTSPWVMAPMIATAQEAADFAALAHEVGLTEPCKVGVMVEVPSAALRAADLLRHVDFVSLGTNDLAQYTMATDRLRGSLADLLDPWQPAVLDLVAATARAGAELGKPVGVCGESAADPLMALVLAGLGITSLSMSPGALPAVRHLLRRHDLDTCRAAADAALAATSASEAREAVRALVDPAVRDALAL
ncbi:phosphoenolpyruvate--protein phosphotransferase [Xylanimonas oleitrophica]|uniref:Phosphoenolpyruvate-protein phosphotransferase n=1 Tax=Xylanimonas oleitrophica TaxID=2607479 RepID=A0A2W5WW54_9MICO|nr:phosphoenolpyruvate--protein phosphotransferase [Xylanimonas oleitrophica]PZR54922.1 phosphoenolpyruvate--protein phosphotransferase [Xylanimonas oleitrophica]